MRKDHTHEYLSARSLQYVEEVISRCKDGTFSRSKQKAVNILIETISYFEEYSGIEFRSMVEHFCPEIATSPPEPEEPRESQCRKGISKYDSPNPFLYNGI